MDERGRLVEIMKSQELNSKQFALELGVSAGTISNILGGRNKPSLEFLQNVANHFPFISPTWLFLGFGEKYIDDYVPTTPSPAEKKLLPQSDTSQNSIALSVVTEETTTRTIQKIVIFYSDGTFEER
jgi:transcriptional regulator with XRE-family HTH domain